MSSEPTRKAIAKLDRSIARMQAKRAALFASLLCGQCQGRKALVTTKQPADQGPSADGLWSIPCPACAGSGCAPETARAAEGQPHGE